MQEYTEIVKNKYPEGEGIEKCSTGCECEKQCDNHCRNRGLYIECGPSCKFNDSCINKRFQKREYAKVTLGSTSLKGKGIFADENIKKNQFIIEYVGEIINHNEMIKRMTQYASLGNPHQYIMAVEKNIFIDSTQCGNIARYINHSCDPNCIVDKWQVNGLTCMGIFATKNIPQGDELTYDYRLETYG